MAKSVVLLLLGLGVLGGCTMGSIEPVPVKSIHVSGISITDAPTLLAEQAYQDDNHLLIQFKQDGSLVYVTATLPSEPAADLPYLINSSLSASVHRWLPCWRRVNNPGRDLPPLRCRCLSPGSSPGKSSATGCVPASRHASQAVV